ncbi:MAG: L,D-transpeptidase [Neisseriaceae bacterium]
MNCTNLIASSIQATTKQVILVQSNVVHDANATIIVCEKNLNGWQQKFPTIPSVVGLNGIAQPNMKKEGDQMTPSGIFFLGEAFSYLPHIESIIPQFKMDYRYISDTKDIDGKYFDKFIDDPSNNAYNSWIVGSTNAKSYEEMRKNTQYEFGIVINYNMNPVVKGKGSAIFMHIWKGPRVATHGCVALDKTNLIKILAWLDKTKQPQILIIPPKL